MNFDPLAVLNSIRQGQSYGNGAVTSPNPGLQNLASGLFAQLDGSQSPSPSGLTQVQQTQASRGALYPQPYSANIDPTQISDPNNKPWFASLADGIPQDISYQGGQTWVSPQAQLQAQQGQIKHLANSFAITPQTSVTALMANPSWNILHATNPDLAKQLYETNTGRDYGQDLDLWQKGRETQQADQFKTKQDIEDYPRNTLQKWVTDGAVRQNADGSWERADMVPDITGIGGLIKQWRPAGIADLAVIRKAGGLQGIGLPGPSASMSNPFVDEYQRRVLQGQPEDIVRKDIANRANTSQQSAYDHNISINPSLAIAAGINHPTTTPSNAPAPGISTTGTDLNSVQGIIPSLSKAIGSYANSPDRIQGDLPAGLATFTDMIDDLKRRLNNEGTEFVGGKLDQGINPRTSFDMIRQKLGVDHPIDAPDYSGISGDY